MSSRVLLGLNNKAEIRKSVNQWRTKAAENSAFLGFSGVFIVVVVVQFGCSHEHKANATGSCVILVCLPAVERVHDYYQITISAWLSEKIGVIRHLPPVN